MDTPIEGYFIVTNEDLVFEIKGNVHPHDRYIAYLRYVVDSSGDRQSGEGKSYRKIYDLENREQYLQENYPHFLEFNEKYNRVLQVVQKKDIAYVLNPVDGLNRFRDTGIHATTLQQCTLDLAEKLVITSGISRNSLGITGSQLVGVSTKESDIDLIVYGKQTGLKLFRELKKNYDLIEGLQGYSGERLSQHVEFRWGKENPNARILKSIEQKKVLQGSFNGFDFFIRLVKYPHEVFYEYHDREYHSLGTRVLNCNILDDSQSMFTPCEYQVSCEEEPDLRFITSYRGRYTEHVYKGMDVNVMGRMEKVVLNDGSFWLQIILGEKDTDYMIPVNY
ncbi:MAG: hypothetical protein ACXAEF_00125 [Candidatus Thorarchaeota archaeon]